MVEIRNRWTKEVILKVDGADLHGADLCGAKLRGVRIKITQKETFLQALKIKIEE